MEDTKCERRRDEKERGGTPSSVGGGSAIYLPISRFKKHNDRDALIHAIIIKLRYLGVGSGEFHV